MALDPSEKALVAWIEAHGEEALELLARTVNINSGTGNAQGVKEVGAIYAEHLEGSGFSTRWVDMASVDRSGHVIGEYVSPQATGLRPLLIGHIDTVFEADSPFQTFDRTGDRATGPGVIDMKGGNVAILFALRALKEAGVLDSTTLRVFFAGDEEITGVPFETSRADLFALAKQSDLALGFEPAFGGSVSSLTVARRGIGKWTLRVESPAGHSSQIFGDALGFGAAYELARILNSFRIELSTEEYLTLNVGLVLGGTGTTIDSEGERGTAHGKMNVLPTQAVARGDLRFISPEQERWAHEKMRAIVAQHLPHTQAQLSFGSTHPPMPPADGNYALLKVLGDVNESLGYGPLDALDPSQRGAADISFVSDQVPGLCGLGPAGGGTHSVEEWLDLRTLPVVTKRTAVLLYRLGKMQTLPI